METKRSLLCFQLPATDSNLQPNKIKIQSIYA